MQTAAHRLEGSPLGVLVVDDERPARVNLARMLTADARFRLLGEARDGLDALAKIELLAPDLLVLDIQMPGLNGFELLEALPDARFHVLFSTASDAHALRAFDAHAVDYLLKPYDGARFQRALDKAYAQRVGSVTQLPHAPLVRTALASERARLAVKTHEGAWVRLVLDDVIQLSAANKYVQVVTRAGNYTVRQPLRELAARLDDRFVRVHRSDVVNVQAVVRMEPWEHGDALLVLSNGSSLVLTRTFRRAFHERFER